MAQPQPVTFGPARSKYEHNPVFLAKQVVERLRNDGTLDRRHKEVLKAVECDEKLRASLQQLLQEEGHMEPGRTYKNEEREQIKDHLTRNKKKQLQDLLRDTVFRILTDESDPNGLAADHELLVHEALLSLLEEEELKQQDKFSQLCMQYFEQEQRDMA